MANKAFYLTENDVEVLSRVLRDYRSTAKQPMRRQEIDEHQAPEVYVAHPQVGVLPGITKADGDLYYRPGKAKCNIYRIVEDVVNEPELRPLCGGDNQDECFKHVYNVSNQCLEQFFPVLRDKFGHWLALSGLQIFTCELTENLLPGDSASAILLIGPAKNENGEIITVFDIPTSITTGKMIANGVTCRIIKDPDVSLAADEYVFLLPFACETNQTGTAT
ncbi:MAG: hypothetical protein WC455_11310 [Dehalococcoidia bacterium]|jgi:hypothetical protein